MKKDVIFSLPSEALEGASEAVLLGDFNNWVPQDSFRLKQQEDGSFQTVVTLESGKTYQYRFLLNDGRWVNDYNAQHYIPVTGLYVENSVITVPEDLENLENGDEVSGTGKKVTKAKAAPKKRAAKAAGEKSTIAAPKTKKASAAPKTEAKKTVKKPAVKKETPAKK